MEFSKSDLQLTSRASTPAAFGNVAPTVLYILSFGRIGPAAAKSKKKMLFENMVFPLGRLFNAKFTVHLDVAPFHSLLLFWQPWAVGWAHPTNQWAGGWHSTIFKTLPSFYDVQACFGSIFFVHMIHIYIYSPQYTYIHTQVHHLYQYPLNIYENITPEAPQSEPSHTGASEKKTSCQSCISASKLMMRSGSCRRASSVLIELEFVDTVDSREANHANPGWNDELLLNLDFVPPKPQLSTVSVRNTHSTGSFQ